MSTEKYTNKHGLEFTYYSTKSGYVYYHPYNPQTYNNRQIYPWKNETKLHTYLDTIKA